MRNATVSPCVRAVAGLCVLLALPGTPPLFAGSRGFTAIEIPPVDTRKGEFLNMSPAGIDNDGHVVGGALLWDDDEENPDAFSRWTGFSFNTASGIASVLDPLDTLVTDILGVTPNGTVFGDTFRPAYWRGKTRTALFLFRPDVGFDFLKRGSRRWIRENFILHDMSDGGNLGGVAWTRSGKRLATVLYRPNEGWIDIAKRYGRLPGVYTEEIRVNDAGDFAIEIYPDVLIPSGKRLERLGPTGREYYLEAVGPGGQVVGFTRRPSRHKYDPGGPSRPFVYTTERGLLDVLPSYLKSGSARWVSSDGVVRGTAKRDRSGDTVFSWDPDAGFRSIDLKEAFESLAPELSFRSSEVVTVNQRGDFIAKIKARRLDTEDSDKKGNVWRFVYFDTRQGLVDLQQVVDDAGLDLRIFFVVDLNDRGEVVAQGYSEWQLPWKGILFVPR